MKRNLYYKIREIYRLRFGKNAGVQLDADLFADSVAADIRAWCFKGQRHLQGDHPANDCFNRILFYISRPEYVEFIKEKYDERKKNRDVQDSQRSGNTAER